MFLWPCSEGCVCVFHVQVCFQHPSWRELCFRSSQMDYSGTMFYCSVFKDFSIVTGEKHFYKDSLYSPREYMGTMNSANLTQHMTVGRWLLNPTSSFPFPYFYFFLLFWTDICTFSLQNGMVQNIILYPYDLLLHFI